MRYAGSMSSVLVDTFLELSEKTSSSVPALLTVNNHNILAQIGSQTQIIAQDQLTGEYPVMNLSYDFTENRQNLNIIDATDAIDYTINFALPKASSRYIPISITETQTTEAWCVLFSAAAIIRTVKGGSLTAADIASYYGLSESEAATNGQIINYAQAMYQMNPLYYETAMSNTQVKDEIDNNRPIYIEMRYNQRTAHAVVLRGYNASAYSVWNPWYTSYETFSISTLTYTPSTDTRAFYWNNSVYNWQ